MSLTPIDRTFGIPDALQSLVPGAQWTLTGDDYSGLTWISEEVAQPTEQEVADEIERLQTQQDATRYQRLRALEYPDFKDYLDGIVKGDQEQVDTYIAACLAVKAKYPKPEELPS